MLRIIVFLVLLTQVLSFLARRTPSEHEGNTMTFEMPRPSGHEVLSALWKHLHRNGIVKPSPQSSPQLPLFDCKLYTTTKVRTTSVHHLRPGDIDVVAALGDSLTAANGALAKHYRQLLIQYHGLAFPIGGDASYHTIPNFLRVYNKLIKGVAHGQSKEAQSCNAGFDMAIPGATTMQLMQEAKALVTKMESDPKIRMSNDWKFINIFIGNNDLCHFCRHRTEFSTENFIARLTEVLDYLHTHVPRAFISLVPPIDVFLVKQLNLNIFCDLAHEYECPCGLTETLEKSHLVKAYTRAMEKLINTGRYDVRNDFTVVLQPLFEIPELPRIPGKKTVDLRYFSVDCFHFSALGHAAAAVGLWNNLFEPVGQKQHHWLSNHTGYICPSKQKPYLFTNKNSRK